MTSNEQPAETITRELDQSSLLQGYLRPVEVARELRVSVRTLSRWHALRQGPPRIKVGRQSLFSAASVQLWLGSLETTPCRTKVKGQP